MDIKKLILQAIDTDQESPDLTSMLSGVTVSVPRFTPLALVLHKCTPDGGLLLIYKAYKDVGYLPLLKGAARREHFINYINHLK